MKIQRLLLGFFCAVSLFLLGACAQTQHSLVKRLNNGEVPKFNGYVSPITIPIQPEYIPIKAKFTQSDAISITSTSNKKTDSYNKKSGTLTIKRLGDFLLWNKDITKIKKDSQTFSSNKPIISARFQTDKYGKFHDIEVTAPALSSQNVSQKEIDKYLESIRHSLKATGAILSKKPVRSGNVIAKYDSNLIDSFLKNENASIEDGLQFVVDGWGVLDDKKVIVSSIDDQMNLKIRNTITRLDISGYMLHDPTSFQIVDSYLLGIAHPPYSESNFSIKILSHYSAQLIN
ncbi:MAG: hypothetical protein K9K64_05215 [Desulfohalobiaceae bacterium]|nr:hypothetical protein [Desulfohalobiaceae bacterium]